MYVIVLHDLGNDSRDQVMRLCALCYQRRNLIQVQAPIFPVGVLYRDSAAPPINTDPTEIIPMPDLAAHLLEQMIVIFYRQMFTLPARHLLYLFNC